METDPYFHGTMVTKKSYVIGVCIVIVSTYAQYFLMPLGPLINAMVVYGIPVLAISWICGSGIIRKAFSNGEAALRYGISSFGVLYIAANLAAIAILFILSVLDPAALQMMNRANPVLHVRPKEAEIMVIVSFLVVGPAEEYIFRGFIFGGLLRLFKNRHWFVPALLSSILFALLHLYYLFIYGVASVVMFVEITFFGIAMAITYYLSGGNLLVPALIHGAFDSTGFVASDLSLRVGAGLRMVMVWVGIFVAFRLWSEWRRKKRKITADQPFDPGE